MQCDKVPPEHIYNMDNTGIMLGGKGGRVRIYGAADRRLQGNRYMVSVASIYVDGRRCYEISQVFHDLGTRAV